MIKNNKENPARQIPPKRLSNLHEGRQPGISIEARPIRFTRRGKFRREEHSR